MPDLKHHIDPERLPNHIAIIMDGNGRWAKSRNRPRVFGHSNGVKAVREVTEACAELGVSYLTLYAFSKENWNRPAGEVNALMSLLVKTLSREIKTLTDNDIRLQAIGDISQLPRETYEALKEGIEKTKHHTRMTLILALNYSSRVEILNAQKRIAADVAEGKLELSDISESVFSGYLDTADYPDPELMIRTSGERRISNYLLWQMAYTELYFTELFWPDFRKQNLYEAIIDYQTRERRFGKTSEQITAL